MPKQQQNLPQRCRFCLKMWKALLNNEKQPSFHFVLVTVGAISPDPAQVPCTGQRVSPTCCEACLRHSGWQPVWRKQSRQIHPLCWPRERGNCWPREVGSGVEEGRRGQREGGTGQMEGCPIGILAWGMEWSQNPERRPEPNLCPGLVSLT